MRAMKNLLIKSLKKNSNVKRSLVMFLVIGTGVFVLSVSSFKAGYFYGIESFFEDIFFSSKPVSSEILILEIDSQSIEKIGQWPWRREIFAQAFSRLEESKPRAVGLDVIMPETSRFGVEDDHLFAEELNEVSYPVILPVESLSGIRINRTGGSFSENILKPVAAFLGAPNVSLGHVNLINDRDGVVRSMPFNINDTHGGVYVGLAYQTVKKSGLEFKGNSSLDPVEHIVFSGPSGSIRRIPFWRVLDSETPMDMFKDKVIFIGATAPDLHDEKPTPFDRGTQMSGVEIQAQIGNMFLNGYRLRDLDATVLLVWILIASFIPCIVFYVVEKIHRAILLTLVVGVIHIIAVLFWFEAGIMANLVHINMAWVLAFLASFFYRFLTTDREKKDMREVFSKYVSGDVLDEILRDTAKVKLGGEEREVTIFFSDIRGFTTLSEGMSPAQLTHFLNNYLTRMTNIILKRRGVVDKYIGDAIMAFWGAPINNEVQAIDAVVASLEMIEALDDFNKENRENGDPEIDIGIGLNTGLVTVGNMGSEVRFDYTVMGDAVNLASRLEGQTKTYGVKILISESTKKELDTEHAEQYNILTREIDKIKVKGKTGAVTIFEVIPKSKKYDTLLILSDFEIMRNFYYEGKWSNCLALTEKILRKVDDGPTRVIEERCKYFMENEPEGWTGVYEMKTK